MNGADFVIIGVVGLLMLVGLKTGILKALSGIGGIALGVMIATQQSGEVAILLEEYIGSDIIRGIAAFAAIVVVIAIATRIVAFLVKKLLSALMLGWTDHIAGALLGAVVGIFVAGTGVYLLTGMELDQTKDLLAGSSLAPQIQQASLISTRLCPNGNGAPGCKDFGGFVNEVFGRDVAADVSDLFGGRDIGSIVNVVKSGLSGPNDDLLNTLKNTEATQETASQNANGVADVLGSAGSVFGILTSVDDIVSAASDSGELAAATNQR